MAELARLTAITKNFGGVRALARRRFRRAGRRGPRAGRRERRRQVDPDAGARRRDGARAPARSGSTASPSSCADRATRAPWHRHHPSGAGAGAGPVGGGEYLSRRAAGGHRLARPAAAGGRTDRSARLRHRSGDCASAASRSPISRWSRSPRRCRARCKIIVFDEPTAVLSAQDAERLHEIIRAAARRGRRRSSTSRTGSTRSSAFPTA